MGNANIFTVATTLEVCQDQVVTATSSLNGFSYQLDGKGIFDAIKTALDGNAAAEITVHWVNPNGGTIHATGRGLGFYGICGKKTADLAINVRQPIAPFSLTSTLSTLSCGQGTTVQEMPYVAGGTYTWNTTGAVVTQNWNQGIYIDHFTQNGQVTITGQVSNACNTESADVTLTVNQPNIGKLQQNGRNVRAVFPDCEGLYDISLPWVSKQAYYTWELPESYDKESGSFTTRIVKGHNVLNVGEVFPDNAVEDYQARVTMTGVCGGPQVITFPILALARPVMASSFSSCDNTVDITLSNPRGKQCSWWSENGGTLSGQTCTKTTFEAPGPGEYILNIGITDDRGCYTELQTLAKIGGVGSGWQSGVLSDIRRAPGSNIVTDYDMNFAGRNGRIYGYTFNRSLSKWLLDSVPNVSNVLKPLFGEFTRIGQADSYMFYISTDRNLYRAKISDGTSVPLCTRLVVEDLLPVSASECYLIDITSTLYLNRNGNNNDIHVLNNVDRLETLLPPNSDPVFLQSNDLYTYNSNGKKTITYSSDIYVSSDVLIFNGFLYFVRGTAGHGNLYRLDITNLVNGNPEQITNTSNLTGKFSINPSTGTIYYGVLVPGKSNIGTLSGNFIAGDIYQAYFKNNTWQYAKATQGSAEGIDMLVVSPHFVGDHLFYVGAGKSSQSISGGHSYLDLEVWNLYYDGDCPPPIARMAAAGTQPVAQSVTAVQPVTQETDLQPFPNPFGESLTIPLPSGAPSDIEILSATGESMLTRTSSAAEEHIDTRNFASGLYFIRIERDGQVLRSAKLVKQ